jgi:hypothetical protein
LRHARLVFYQQDSQVILETVRQTFQFVAIDVGLEAGYRQLGRASARLQTTRGFIDKLKSLSDNLLT